ncbi:helix-hairpin-helix domain-containing protein [Paenibacillus sp. NFR01]|uniref:ComEA family DNA-binding protein n=1 Tax=Paenibacillus sp. NFR01 TaxID=1566279 RepID=UPI0008B923BB|nr:helix-hairpin-helix domain-containing protein [Paenibacillus sp. NFR01]SET67514.1 competence protein ComEA [Paenibacillus sp. NFR01]
MERKTLMTGIAALLLGGGLVWGADHAGPQGIAGWTTLNSVMEQALDTAQAAEAVPSAAAEGAGAGKAAVAAESGGTAAAGNGAALGTGSAAASAAMPSASAAPGGAGQAVSPGAGTVNVNTAGVKELMDLPGIGEKKAQAIIDYRNQQGVFRSISDLGKVKGIGPKMLEKLKPLVGF